MTFQEYKGVILAKCLTNNVASRIGDALLMIQYLAGVSTQDVFDQLKYVDDLMGIKYDGKPPYDPKCTIPLNATVRKTKYFFGDITQKGAVGTVVGGVIAKNLKGVQTEVIYVKFDGMEEDTFNGVFRSSIEEV